ncbi:hypothetical protein R1flu_019988 [Riccia fluitans]|uniref:Kinesin motor domain-containing protein n=1 Tax=Riccia fluitans TaxID=41844 RepID=A0ABD1ZLM8_9MARC
MPPLLTRSRTIRGVTSPAESPVKEREPFTLGPFRQHKGFPAATASGRRARGNGENVPPDNVYTAAYVKANTIHQDSGSPAVCKSGSKRNGIATPLPGSPALLPRPPASKPSPAHSRQKLEPPTGPIQDPLGAAKRKLSWDSGHGSTAVENSAGCISTEADGSDTGVKVMVRMRPLNAKEEQEEATLIVHKVSTNAVALGDQQFTYDSVAGVDASQQEVFNMVGLPMVENCLAGFNSSIFAYGQTGSGKTHTMWGATSDAGTDLSPSKDRGITPRVFEQLFARMMQEEKLNLDKALQYQCRCSFLEIYNEQITDLLESNQKNLQIREDTKTGVYVENLSEVYVSTVDDVTRLLLKGLSNRRTGSTAMNNESSRSHSVFTCVIDCHYKNLAEGCNTVRSSRMNLVDLAGSERQKQTGAAGERLKEAGNINKSLSQLGNVINILAEVAQTGKQRHIPYRDSRLTFLLQESLGGNAKLAMICAISPASSCRSETLSTLRFAQRAKAVQNKAVVNEENASDVNLLREQIRQLKDELKRMKTNGAQEPGTGGYSNGWNARRSYNLLRLSLSHPMTISAADLDVDNDHEMEIDEDDCEREPASKPASDSKGVALKAGASRLEAIEEKEWIPDTPMEVEGFGSCEGTSIIATDVTREPISSSSPLPQKKESEASTPKTGSKLDPLPQNNDREASHDAETELNIEDENFPNLKTPESIKLPDLVVPKLHSPPLSVSPRLRGSTKKSLSGSPLGRRPGVASPISIRDSLVSDEVYHSTEERFRDSSTLQSLQLKSQSVVRSEVRSSMSSVRPTERLAACLHRGLQILDNQQRTSMAVVRSSSAGLRFSVQNADFRIPRLIEKADKSIQTTPPVLVSTGSSPVIIGTKSVVLFEEISSFNLEFASADYTSRDEAPTSTTSVKEIRQESDKDDSCNLDLPETDHVHISEQEALAESTDCHAEQLEEGSLQPACEHVSGLQAAPSFVADAGKNEFQVIPGILPSPSERHELSGSSSLAELENKQLQVASTQTPERMVVDPGTSPTSKQFMLSNHPSSSQDASLWQLIPVDAQKPTSQRAGIHSGLHVAEAIENLLTGAIRRERVAEELVCKQAAEIEQLNRLVRQYKHERECNAILHQTREDKIARLESLMENVIPTDEYLSEEWSALLLEHQLLQEKFDNHPEITNSSVEQQRLLEELNKYRMFYDLGEREVLLEEISQLRNQLQSLLENTGNNSAGKNRRLSMTRKSMQVGKSEECSGLPQTARSLYLIPAPQDEQASQKQHLSDNSKALVVTDPRTSEQLRWEEEKQEWEARERDWMSALEEMREEVESYKRIAEKRKQEFESEKRCADEVQEALQMAMAGHARLLEQYADLQEKHIGLLAKQRKIRETTVDVKKMAKRAGVSNFESKWLDAQAAQMAAMKVDFEEERRAAREEIQGLQVQLRDTAEAVQAAGELLVRLKEAEESVMVAQDAAAVAEQSANATKRELEKSRRRHATEIATLQQRLLESRLQKTAVCPMCVMAERVKFQFSEVDAETAQATIEAEARAMALKEEKEWMAKQRQIASEEERRTHSEHDMDDYASVRTGEFEVQDYDSEGGLQLEEFDDLDHFFVPSHDAYVHIRTPEKR